MLMKSILQKILFCGLLGAIGVGVPYAEPAADAPDGHIVVIPIRDMIEPALLYVIRRGLTEAEQQSAAALIFVMDTPGGTVGAAEEIIKIIENVDVPTYTYIEKNGISAGAIIALATDHIYMAPGSKIGDAMPIMMSPFGGVQETSEGIEEKTVSYVAALIRSTAQNAGHNDELAEAMVRRELEYKIGDEIICPEGQLLTLTNVEAERRYGDDDTPLLSEGTVDDLDTLIEQLGLSGREIKEFKVSAAERIARVIAGVAPLFLMAGLLGIYLEIKTPGIGLPGLLGAVSLILFFWGHHIAGLAGMEDLALFIVGVCLLLIELLVIPGFGVVGLLGLAFMFTGLLMAMVERYPGGPIIPEVTQFELPLMKMGFTLVLTAAGAYVIGRLLPHTPVFGRLVLTGAASREAGFHSADLADDLTGQEGETITPCNPGGRARFGAKKYDVITRGISIDPGTRVRIMEAHGNRLVVEPLEKE